MTKNLDGFFLLEVVNEKYNNLDCFMDNLNCFLKCLHRFAYYATLEHTLIVAFIKDGVVYEKT
jgi:ribonuclease HIII